jgi:hypothetical protein
MNFEEVKGLVDENIDLIAYSKQAFKEATERTTKFLMVVAVLADYKLELEQKKAKLTTIREAQYHNVISVAEGKTVTEKKVVAEAHPQYAKSREDVELVEAEISWTKTYIEIFNSAHVTFRQMARGE